MRMIEFSCLLDELLLNSSKKKKIKILKSYFKKLSNENKGWVVAILSGYKPTNAIKARDIKDLIKKKYLMIYLITLMNMLVILLRHFRCYGQKIILKKKN